ncbi:MAG: diacylglycerol kinase family lipid kinase [Chryseobacterium sp.]|nr:diacylglycerol kinase family lipid kinase [Chryseobacterium sp.]
MEERLKLKILFVINHGSGSQNIDWPNEIKNYFKPLDFTIEIFNLKKGFKIEDLKEKIEVFHPDQVVAVGGDGTINLIAECILRKNIKLGILPAGSANGLARELRISEIPAEALKTITNGISKKIHVIKVNGNLCIHLSDIGFNAWMIKKFQAENVRGHWGYFKANLKVIWSILFVNTKINVFLKLDNENIETKSGMIVIANAREYGSGAIINPTGSLEDDVFEVIVIKKISVAEVFKMLVSHTPFNPQKTQVFKTKNLKIQLSKKMHFQVDGEYLGKVKEIEAYIIPAAIEIIVPSQTNSI